MDGLDWLSYRHMDEPPRIDPPPMLYVRAHTDACSMEVPGMSLPLRLLDQPTGAPSPPPAPLWLPSAAPVQLPRPAAWNHGGGARTYAMRITLIEDVSATFGLLPDAERMITHMYLKSSGAAPQPPPLGAHAAQQASGHCRLEAEQRAQVAACTQRVCQQLCLPHDPQHIASVVGTTLSEMQLQAHRTGIGSSSSDVARFSMFSLRMPETQELARGIFKAAMEGAGMGKAAAAAWLRKLDALVKDRVVAFGNADIGHCLLATKEQQVALEAVRDFAQAHLTLAGVQSHLPSKPRSSGGSRRARSSAASSASVSAPSGRSSQQQQHRNKRVKR